MGLIHAGAQLMADAAAPSSEDAAIAGDVREASEQLGWFLDRAIEAARMERGRDAVPGVVELTTIVDAGIRRARRHMSGLTVNTPDAVPDVAVHVDPAACERLIADVILFVCRERTVDVTCSHDERGAEFTATGTPDTSRITTALRRLAADSAHRCGVEMVDGGTRVTLRLPFA